MTKYYLYININKTMEAIQMDMMITSIKISRKVREAARIRANNLNLSFQSYYEDLILHDIKENEPELFKELCNSRELNKNRRPKKTAIQMEIEAIDQRQTEEKKLI